MGPFYDAVLNAGELVTDEQEEALAEVDLQVSNQQQKVGQVASTNKPHALADASIMGMKVAELRDHLKARHEKRREENSATR